MKLPINSIEDLELPIKEKKTSTKSLPKLSKTYSIIASYENILKEQETKLKEVQKTLDYFFESEADLNINNLNLKDNNGAKGKILELLCNTYNNMDNLIKLVEIKQKIEKITSNTNKSNISINQNITGLKMNKLKTDNNFNQTVFENLTELRISTFLNFTKSLKKSDNCLLKNFSIELMQTFFDLLSINTVIKNSVILENLLYFIESYFIKVPEILERILQKKSEKLIKNFNFFMQRIILLDACYGKYFNFDISLLENLHKYFNINNKLNLTLNSSQDNTELYLFFDRSIENFNFINVESDKTLKYNTIEFRIPYKKDIPSIIKEYMTINKSDIEQDEKNINKLYISNQLLTIFMHSINNYLINLTLTNILNFIECIKNEKYLKNYMKYLLFTNIHLYLLSIVNKLGVDEILPFVEFVKCYEDKFKNYNLILNISNKKIDNTNINDKINFNTSNLNILLENLNYKYQKLLPPEEISTLLQKYITSITKNLSSYLDRILTKIHIDFKSENIKTENLILSEDKISNTFFKSISNSIYDNLENVMQIENKNRMEGERKIIKVSIKFINDINILIYANYYNKNITKQNLNNSHKITINKKYEEEYLISIINGCNLIVTTLKSLPPSQNIYLLFYEIKNLKELILKILVENIFNEIRNLEINNANFYSNKKNYDLKIINDAYKNDCKLIIATLNDYFLDYSKVFNSDDFLEMYKKINLEIIKFYLTCLSNLTNRIDKSIFNYKNLIELINISIKILSSEIEINILALIVNFLEAGNEQIRNVQGNRIKREGNEFIYKIVNEFYIKYFVNNTSEEFNAN